MFNVFDKVAEFIFSFTDGTSVFIRTKNQNPVLLSINHMFKSQINKETLFAVKHDLKSNRFFSLLVQW